MVAMFQKINFIFSPFPKFSQLSTIYLPLFRSHWTHVCCYFSNPPKKIHSFNLFF
jgi:hypothetical protein